MSELKAFDITVAEEGYFEGIVKYRRAVYDKSEADKVIAEMDKEIEELKKQVHDYAQGLYVIQARAEKELRYHKYRRCLAMAKWCDEVMLSCELRGYTVHRIWANKHKWAMRWKYRWLELAKKFKEGFVIGVDKATGTDKTVVINYKEAK